MTDSIKIRGFTPNLHDALTIKENYNAKLFGTIFTIEIPKEKAGQIFTELKEFYNIDSIKIL